MRKSKIVSAKNSRIAFARALLKPYLAVLRGLGIVLCSEKAVIEECLFPVYVVARSQMKAVLKASGLKRRRLGTEPCQLRSGRADYVGAKNGRFKVTSASLDDEERAMLAAAVIGYRKMFLSLSRRLGGMVVHLHCGAKRRTERRRPTGVLHIFAMSSPPGESDTDMAETIFGLPITREREMTLLHKPTPGRGIAFNDGFGKNVVQVLNGNAYFLVPTINCYHGEVSRLIMRKLIASVVDGIFLEKKIANKKSPKELGAQIREHAQAIAIAFDKEIALVRLRIERAQKEQITGERMLAEMQEGLAICASPEFVRRREKMIISAVRAIGKMPLVKSWYFRDGGLHVESRRIIIEERGKRYDMGSFILRFGERGLVSVWNEHPTHPKGEPHPHISAENGACFGSATRAIAKASAEMRYADATGIILSWLRDGYAEETALIKIREWPQIRKGGKK